MTPQNIKEMNDFLNEREKMKLDLKKGALHKDLGVPKDKKSGVQVPAKIPKQPKAVGGRFELNVKKWHHESITTPLCGSLEESIMSAISEAKTKVGEYAGTNKVAKVYKLSGQHNEGDPYVVHLHVNGKHHEPSDYFSNDLDDAHGTAKHMVKESKEIVDTPRTGKEWHKTVNEPLSKKKPTLDQFLAPTYSGKGSFKKLKEDLDEAVNPWKTYERLEDNNDHSGNVVHMAKHVGDTKDVAEAKRIKAVHMKEGHLSDINGYDRQILSKKLWPKFHKAFAPKD